MKATTLKRAIEKRGGTAKIKTERHEANEFHTAERTTVDLWGELKGYDIHMIGGEHGESSFYTARRVANRGQYDQGSDYNSGGYTFCHTQNDLDWITS